MDRLIAYLKAHATSLGSYAAVVLTLASTLLASGVIGPDTTAYHVLGYVAAVLTALGFKAATSTSPADKPSA